MERKVDHKPNQRRKKVVKKPWWKRRKQQSVQELMKYFNINIISMGEAWRN